MRVKEAYYALKKLMDDGHDELEMYTEYEKIDRIHLDTAGPQCDGSSLELEQGMNFVYIQTDH